MTGAIYVRYSPRIEQDQSFTLENQISMCRELAVKDGVLIDENHIYQDHHLSGGSSNRPAFERMLENIWAGNFPDYLYAKDASRISRQAHEAGWLLDKIWSHGVKVRYCLGDFGDPRQSADVQLNYNMVHAINQYQRAKKAEETHHHQKQNALAGYSNGGRPPYGYRNQRIVLKNERNENQHKVIRQLDPDTSPAVKLAFERHLEGVGANTIAAELNSLGFSSQNGNRLTKSTICSWFRNPYPFAGCYVWNRTDKDHKVNPKEEWVIVPDAFPAIISYQQADGIYQRAQQNKNIAPNKGLKRPSKYLLTGLIVCPLCQSHFVVNSDHRRKQYHYICGTRNRISQGCSNKLWIQMKRFEDQLMSQIEGVIFQDGPLEEYLRLCQENQPDYEREAKKEIAVRQQKIKAADNRMKNLVNALADKILPAETIQAKYAEEENKARQIRHELHQLEQQPVAEVIDLPKFRHLLKEELQQEDARKAAMTGLISKIEAYPDRKIVVDFRIGEVEKRTHGDPGGPHEWSYPVRD